MRSIRAFTFRTIAGCLALSAGLVHSGGANAEPVSDFYSSNTVRLVTGGAPGGGYDLYLRALADHFSRHVPGTPTVVVENRTGAGGLNAVNYVYNAARKDGSILIMPHNMHPTFQLLRPKGVKFDARKFGWLGNMAELNNVIAVSSATGVKSIEDAKRKETIFGVSSKGSQSYIVPVLFNTLLGTKFKLVLGYAGTSPMMLAMEQGEIHGRVGSWYIWTAAKPDWIRDGKVTLLAQDGLARNPDLPDVPLYEELVESSEEKAMMRFMSYQVATSRALAAPPGIPADRLAALRTAFMATLNDPEFLRIAKRQRMEVTPKDHAYVESIIQQMFGTPPALIEKLKRIFADS